MQLIINYVKCSRNVMKMNVIFTVLCTFRRKQGFVIGKIIRHINFPRGKKIHLIRICETSSLNLRVDCMEVITLVMKLLLLCNFISISHY